MPSHEFGRLQSSLRAAALEGSCMTGTNTSLSHESATKAHRGSKPPLRRGRDGQTATDIARKRPLKRMHEGAGAY